MDDFKTEFALIKREVAENTKMTTRIYDLLVGNGKPGMRTDVELLKASQKRARVFNGTLFFLLLGLALRMIFM